VWCEGTGKRERADLPERTRCGERAVDEESTDVGRASH
jgi:hypothetical protein